MVQSSGQYLTSSCQMEASACCLNMFIIIIIIRFFINSFAAKFQRTFVVCFSSKQTKFICKVEKLNYEPSHLDLCCLQSLLSLPLAVKELMCRFITSKRVVYLSSIIIMFYRNSCI